MQSDNNSKKIRVLKKLIISIWNLEKPDVEGLIHRPYTFNILFFLSLSMPLVLGLSILHIVILMFMSIEVSSSIIHVYPKHMDLVCFPQGKLKIAYFPLIKNDSYQIEARHLLKYHKGKAWYCILLKAGRNFIH